MAFWNPLTWFDRLNPGEYRDVTAENSGMMSPIANSINSGFVSGTQEKRYYERLALVKKFFDVIQTRRQLITTLNDLGRSPISRLVTNAYLREGFYANNKMEVFNMSFTGPAKTAEVQGKIDKFTDDFNMHLFLRKMLPNFLRIGESLVQPVVRQGEGVVELLDNPRIEDILPIYKGGNLRCFYKLTNNPMAPVERYDKDYFLHLVMPGEPIRVQVQLNVSGFTEIYNLPEYLEVGRSIFIDAIDLIKRLDMLDVSNLALALRQVFLPLLIAVGVPAGATSNDILELTSKYEQRIEDLFLDAGNLGGNFDVAQLLTMVSKVRAIPQHTDGKGNLSVLDLGSDKAPNTEQTSQIKKDIALLTNTPYQFLDSLTLEGVDRQVLLKNYAGFTKNLCDVQFACSHFLKSLYVLHLNALGYPVKKHELSVSYKQMVNVDLLETTELFVGSATSLKEIFDSVSSIAYTDGSELEVDWDTVLKLVNGVVENIPNAQGILRKKSPIEIKKYKQAQEGTDSVDDGASTDTEVGMDDLSKSGNPSDIPAEDFNDIFGDISSDTTVDEPSKEDLANG